MRDPDRIDVILGKISKIWHRSPDQRLCQLIDNCFINTPHHGQDLYYIEDDDLYTSLITYLKELNLVEDFNKKRKE